jgi:hypothetical protein
MRSQALPFDALEALPTARPVPAFCGDRIAPPDMVVAGRDYLAHAICEAINEDGRTDRYPRVLTGERG